MSRLSANFHLRQRQGLAVVGIALAFIASACTGSFESFERAVELAMDKGTARMESRTVVGASAEGEESGIRAFVTASFDFRSDLGELSLAMEFDPPADGPVPEPCRMVVEEDVTYVKVAKGPGWLRTDLTSLQEADDPSATDPREAFDLLKAVFGDAQGVGFEEVRGVKTRHWRAFVDIDRLLEASGQARERGLFGRLAEDKLPVDIWVGEDGLPRRIEYTINSQVLAASVDVHSWTEIFDYGQPVAIELPASSEVEDEPNPAGALLACMGGRIG